MMENKNFLKKLDDISTHAEDVHHLGDPEHKEYQKCWRNFYRRYHLAILDYIHKKTKGRLQVSDIEDIASIVYERGFRWNFKRHQGVRFRILLKQIVKDAIWLFWNNQKNSLKYEDIDMDNFSIRNNNEVDRLSIDIFSIIVKKILCEFPPKQKLVLEWIWKNGKWPSAEMLAKILEIESDSVEKRKAAARQWKKRNKSTWDHFQSRICYEIELLAIGEGNQKEELQFFTNLSI